MHGSWPIHLAAAGLAIMGAESVLVAPASASLAAAILPAFPLTLQSVLTQILLVGTIVLVLAMGLEGRSRGAYVAGLAIALVPLASWAYLLATRDPAAMQRPMTLLVLTPLLVLAALVWAWPEFWQRPHDNATQSPPRDLTGADRSSRPH